jgi:hypothetical protein
VTERLRRIPASLVLAATLLGGCGGDVLGPNDYRQWSEARTRWDNRGYSHYHFEILVSCFCAPEVSQWTRVYVVNGEVAGAHPVAGGEWHQGAALQYWPTIDALFASIVNRSSGERLKSITARYHPQLGFPQRLDFSYDPGLMDAGALYQVRNVTAFEPCGPLGAVSEQPAGFWLARCSQTEIANPALRLSFRRS